MQTFLTYRSITLTAKSLDMRRLGKQRVETKQILTALENPKYGWQHHPATKMWRGHEYALAFYGYLICKEWISRGYKDSLSDFFFKKLIDPNNQTPWEWPVWIDDERVYTSHRSNLLRKNPEHYRKYWPDEPDDLPYFWPMS